MKFKSLSLFSSRVFAYRFFKLFPKWKEFNTNRLKDFTTIIREFHQELKKAVVEERYGVELPLSMGKIMVISYRSNRTYPRFAVAADKAPVPYLNLHTNGLNCKIVYSNHERRYRVKDRYLWSFVPDEDFRKTVSYAFAVNYSRYVFSPDKTPGNAMKIEMETRKAMNRKIQKFLLTYNEFDFQ